MATYKSLSELVGGSKEGVMEIVSDGVYDVSKVVAVDVKVGYGYPSFFPTFDSISCSSGQNVNLGSFNLETFNILTFSNLTIVNNAE